MVSQFEICPELHTDEYGDSGMTTLPTVDWAVPRQSQVLGSDSLLPGDFFVAIGVEGVHQAMNNRG